MVAVAQLPHNKGENMTDKDLIETVSELASVFIDKAFPGGVTDNMRLSLSDIYVDAFHQGVIFSENHRTTNPVILQ